ncbi:hypothetical protein TYRP_009760 [Tyrophagus putrescentiae]|nr:hypothetical protein TYRP_009760 [Tyrophagus putrescentiae]
MYSVCRRLSGKVLPDDGPCGSGQLPTEGVALVDELEGVQFPEADQHAVLQNSRLGNARSIDEGLRLAAARRHRDQPLGVGDDAVARENVRSQQLDGVGAAIRVAVARLGRRRRCSTAQRTLTAGSSTGQHGRIGRPHLGDVHEEKVTTGPGGAGNVAASPQCQLAAVGVHLHNVRHQLGAAVQQRRGGRLLAVDWLLLLLLFSNNASSKIRSHRAVSVKGLWMWLLSANRDAAR